MNRIKLDEVTKTATLNATVGVSRVQILGESIDEHTEKYAVLMSQLSAPGRQISNEQAESLVAAYSELLGLIGYALETSVSACDSFVDNISAVLTGVIHD